MERSTSCTRARNPVVRCIKIQACFRGYFDRIHFQEYVRRTKLTRLRDHNSARCQGVPASQYESELERQRWLVELRMRRTELQVCAVIARDHLLLKETKKSRNYKGATQALFHKLCEMSRSKEGISTTTFIKLGKTAAVDNRRVKLNTLDLAISKQRVTAKPVGRDWCGKLDLP